MPKDHLGNKFKTKTELAKHYGITKETLNYRLHRGQSLEEALTGNQNPSSKLHKNSQVTDHLGNVFDNTKAMCEHYNISYYLYQSRRSRGFSLEEALTQKYDTATYKKITTPVRDHCGNIFFSVIEMCDYYNVSPTSFYKKRKAGKSLEECLSDTRKTKVNYMVKDHLGNKFMSIKEMAEHYGIEYGTLAYRLRKGYSMEEALTKESKYFQTQKKCCDHNGVEYDSVLDMLKAYGIKKHNFYQRLKRGWTLERALTTPVETK